MRRIPVLLSVVAVVLLGIVALAGQPRVFAQDATPTMDEAMEEGLTFEALAFAAGVELASPSDLIVSRISVEAGAGFPIEESDPTTGLLIVESGAFTVQVDAPWTVSRAGSFEGAMATAVATGVYTPVVEEIASGEAATLEAGDSAFIPASVNGELRNDGDEPAVGLAFLIAPPDPSMTGGATPTP